MLERSGQRVLVAEMFWLQDVLNKQLERAASQAEQECQAILAAPGASRPGSAAATPEGSHASEAPRKQPRGDKPSMEDQLMAQVSMVSILPLRLLPDLQRNAKSMQSSAADDRGGTRSIHKYQ